MTDDDYGLVVMEVEDPEVWDRIRNGRLRGFSIAPEDEA